MRLDACVTLQVAGLRSNLWPGAAAVASGAAFTNVYVGWGVKTGPFLPLPPPPVAQEYDQVGRGHSQDATLHMLHVFADSCIKHRRKLFALLSCAHAVMTHRSHFVDTFFLRPDMHICIQRPGCLLPRLSEATTAPCLATLTT